MASAISTILDNISELSISGVTVKDIDQVQDKLEDRDCPCLFPNPLGLVTNLNVEPDAYGNAGDRPYTVTYTLNYRLCNSSVGSGRGLFDKYPAMVTNALAVIWAFIGADNLGGTVEFQVSGIANFGPVADPAGKLFHGCDIAVNVTEFIN